MTGLNVYHKQLINNNNEEVKLRDKSHIISFIDHKYVIIEVSLSHGPINCHL